MNLYNIKSADGEFRITKFDEDLNPVEGSSYLVSDSGCECPQWQGRSKECRHMKMLPMMEERADTPWFFCFDGPQAGMWFDPTGEANPSAVDRAIANAIEVEEQLAARASGIVDLKSLTEMPPIPKEGTFTVLDAKGDIIDAGKYKMEEPSTLRRRF